MQYLDKEIAASALNMQSATLQKNDMPENSLKNNPYQNKGKGKGKEKEKSTNMYYSCNKFKRKSDVLYFDCSASLLSPREK